MTEYDPQELVQLKNQLADALSRAAYYAERMLTVVAIAEEQTHQNGNGFARKSQSGLHYPLIDQATFSVTWQGKSVRLGHTRSFWLLVALSRRPNKYVTHLDLLSDVWENEDLTTATIRSTVCQLRRRLIEHGMGGLASAIQGHNGHYVLML